MSTEMDREGLPLLPDGTTYLDLTRMDAPALGVKVREIVEVERQRARRGETTLPPQLLRAIAHLYRRRTLAPYEGSCRLPPLAVAQRVGQVTSDLLELAR